MRWNLLDRCTYYTQHHWVIALSAAFALVLVLAAAILRRRQRAARWLGVCALLFGLAGCGIGAAILSAGLDDAAHADVGWLSEDPVKVAEIRSSRRQEALYCGAGAVQLQALPLFGAVALLIALRRRH